MHLIWNINLNMKKGASAGKHVFESVLKLGYPIGGMLKYKHSDLVRNQLFFLRWEDFTNG